MEESCIIEELALTHQMMALLGLDDLTYTHITMRSLEHPGHYYVARLGPLFSQVTSKDIVRVDSKGQVVFPIKREVYNKTGHFVHYDIYGKRPDVNAIIHTHTPSTIAVASIKGGLRFYCQFSYLFYQNIGYMPYEALALDQSPQIPAALGNHSALLMENHGAITVGKTIYEALFFSMFLDKAADVQLKIMATRAEPLMVPEAICLQARDQMIGFEANLGHRDWAALKERLLNNRLL